MPPPAKKTTFSSLLKGTTDFRRQTKAPDALSIDTARQATKCTAGVPPTGTPVSPPTRMQTFENFVSGAGTDVATAKLPLSDINKQAALPPGSPMKRAGWLANMVPTRFRSTSVEAPPSPQAQQAASKPPSFSTSSAPVVNAGSTNAQAAVDSKKARLLGVFPPVKEDVPELEGLLEICFPYTERPPPLSDFSVANLRRTLQERHRTYRSPDSTFVLTIASASNPTEITYAVCVHAPLFPEDNSHTESQDGGAGAEPTTRLPTHGCVCLLTTYPFFSLFFKVVFGIASIWESKRKEYVQDCTIAMKERKAPPAPLTMTDFLRHFEGIMKRLKEMRVPSMGGWTRLVLAPQHTPLAFHRPHSESVKAERRMLVLEYAAPMLFALLSVDQVLFLLGCLCSERKVLVVSDHANIVSSCVLALITLLDPLQWAGPVITLLPPRLDELLEAPVPLIAGRVSINSAAIPSFSTLNKPMRGVIEMNMDQNNLCMHEDDLMSYHELKLPGCDALVHELKPQSSLLFERHLTAEFPTVEQMQACEAICRRIHLHMKAMCALASGDTGTLDLADLGFYVAAGRTHKGDMTGGTGTGAGAGTIAVQQRHCSDAVTDYIRRFRETQMYSMYQLQRQEEEQEEDAATAEDESYEDDGHDGSRVATSEKTLTENEENGSDDDDDDDSVVLQEEEDLGAFEQEVMTYEVQDTDA
ncbi:hypothetical protein PINS_up014501 [Pythium insidiosum]|nr:hypothetical protein PINS_up014501 [Pythium insidiosum]